MPRQRIGERPLPRKKGALSAAHRGSNTICNEPRFEGPSACTGKPFGPQLRGVGGVGYALEQPAVRQRGNRRNLVGSHISLNLVQSRINLRL